MVKHAYIVVTYCDSGRLEDWTREIDGAYELEVQENNQELAFKAATAYAKMRHGKSFEIFPLHIETISVASVQQELFDKYGS
jgi:hypothetical protein